MLKTAGKELIRLIFFLLIISTIYYSLIKQANLQFYANIGTLNWLELLQDLSDSIILISLAIIISFICGFLLSVLSSLITSNFYQIFFSLVTSVLIGISGIWTACILVSCLIEQYTIPPLEPFAYFGVENNSNKFLSFLTINFFPILILTSFGTAKILQHVRWRLVNYNATLKPFRTLITINNSHANFFYEKLKFALFLCWQGIIKILPALFGFMIVIEVAFHKTGIGTTIVNFTNIEIQKSISILAMICLIALAIFACLRFILIILNTLPKFRIEEYPELQKLSEPKLNSSLRHQRISTDLSPISNIISTFFNKHSTTHLATLLFSLFIFLVAIICLKLNTETVLEKIFSFLTNGTETYKDINHSIAGFTGNNFENLKQQMLFGLLELLKNTTIVIILLLVQTLSLLGLTIIIPHFGKFQFLVSGLFLFPKLIWLLPILILLGDNSYIWLNFLALPFALELTQSVKAKLILLQKSSFFQKLESLGLKPNTKVILAVVPKLTNLVLLKIMKFSTEIIFLLISFDFLQHTLFTEKQFLKNYIGELNLGIGNIFAQNQNWLIEFNYSLILPFILILITLSSLNLATEYLLSDRK